MTQALLTPTAHAPGRNVGGRTFRKQILKAGGLDYRTPDGTTRRLEFNEPYFADLSTAFRERAYDSVKAIMATDTNAHTMDPERMRGTVVDLVPSEDGSGLDAIMTLSENAANLVQEHPDLGVSTRIVENHTRGDGKSWPRAIQHVLLTTDPKVTGLSPWKAVDLSTEAGAGTGPVIDLSTHVLTETKGGAVSDLSDSDLERIVGEVAGRLNGGQNSTPDEPIDWGDFFDDDVDEAAIADFFASMDDEGDGEGGSYADADPFADDFDNGAGEPVGAGAGAELSNPADDERYVDLAEQNAALSEQMSTMHAELSSARWEKERESLLNQGVPPAMLDLATPVLQAAHQGAVLDLSNAATGESVSPAQVVRSLLKQAAGIVDLSQEVGHGAPATSTGADDTAAAHAAWEATFGGK